MTAPAPKPPTHNSHWFTLGVLVVGGLIALGALAITKKASDAIQVIEAVVVLVTVVLAARHGGPRGGDDPDGPGHPG